MPKAQVSVTFNWIYVLIAGGVILLFFFGLVLKQKNVSEERLGADLVITLKSIFIGAGAAEKTKNFIETGGLSEYTLYFQCDDKVSTFGIEGTSTKAEDAITPIFTPTFIKSSQLITWSLPYKLPYKVTDLLMVTAPTVKYYLIGDSTPPGFKLEFLNATDNFNREEVNDLNEYGNIDPKLNFEVRIVDLDGATVPNKGIPKKLIAMDDDKVTAVSFLREGIIYYQKQGSTWRRLHSNPLPLVSLGGEKDAAKYAAIFAGNNQLYECNMQKAFQRLEYLTEIYKEKNQDRISYYQNYSDNHPASQIGSNCLTHLLNDDLSNLEGELTAQLGAAETCNLDPDKCGDLIFKARSIRVLNEKLIIDGCIPLY